MLDPRRTNIALDANALDRGSDASRGDLVDQFEKLANAGVLTVVVGSGVRQEVQHPRTPRDVRAAVLPRIFNLRPGLISTQQNQRQRVLAVIQGNARPGQHAADASHLSEAEETGCGYFITHDARILRKRDELRRVLPLSLSIVTLSEFFEAYDSFVTLENQQA